MELWFFWLERRTAACVMPSLCSSRCSRLPNQRVTKSANPRLMKRCCRIFLDWPKDRFCTRFRAQWYKEMRGDALSSLPLSSSRGGIFAACRGICWNTSAIRSEEHTSELQSRQYLVCRLLLEKKKINDVKRHFQTQP